MNKIHIIFSVLSTIFISILLGGGIIANPKALILLYATLRYEREVLAGFLALGVGSVIMFAIDSKNSASNLMLKWTYNTKSYFLKERKYVYALTCIQRLDLR